MKQKHYIYGLLFFLFMGSSHDAWANLKLNVNAKTTAWNQITYMIGAIPAISLLPWKEKAQYGIANAIREIEPCITITNAAVGDLIVKLDVVQVIPIGTNNTIEVKSYWLKYGLILSPLGYTTKVIELVENGHAATGGNVIVNKAILKTLCLLNQVPKGKVTTLFDFIALNFPINAHLIFTAILIDDVNASQQVIGVDIQTVYFDPNWKNLIQSGNP